MLEFTSMSGSKEARLAEVEYLSFAHRLEVAIEESIVSSGRNSLQLKTFEDQLRLKTARHETERDKIKWEIWDEFVWTPGYVNTYEQTKLQISSWTDALISEARAEYGKRYGLRALRRDSDLVRANTLADLPKRMAALAARAKVKASAKYKS